MKSGKKVSRAIKYAELASIFDARGKYKVYKDSEGARRILKRDDETRTYSHSKIALIADEIYMLALEHGDEYTITSTDSEEVGKCWVKLSEPIAAPREIGFFSDEDYVFHRLKFDRKEDVTLDDLPFTKSILDRMNDAEAFCAFIGSLWHDESYRHQFIWFYGPGKDGKSTLTAALHEIFGTGATSVNVPDDQSSARFWNTNIENKRIAIFDDAENTKFTSSGKFKALTGDEFMVVEHKGKLPYKVKNNCKFIFVSNNEPSIKTDVADFRRMIICEITPPVSPWREMGREFVSGVKRESGAFFNYCLNIYAELCPEHDEIPVSDTQQELQQEAADTTEAVFQCLLDSQFRLSSSGQCLATKVTEKCSSSKVQHKDFVGWLKKRHGLEMKRVHGRDGGNYYKGIVAIESGIVA